MNTNVVIISTFYQNYSHYISQYDSSGRVLKVILLRLITFMKYGIYKRNSKPIDKFISFSVLFILIELEIGSSCDNS